MSETFMTRVVTQYNGGHYFDINISLYPKLVEIIPRESKMNSPFIIKNAAQVFLGIDNAEQLHGSLYQYKQDGNSVLIKLGDKRHVFVNREIWMFEVCENDQIVEFYSPTCNSYVPYPYAIGKEHTYLLAEVNSEDGVPYITNNALKTKDPYEQYYNHSKSIQDSRCVCSGRTKARKIIDGSILDTKE